MLIEPLHPSRNQLEPSALIQQFAAHPPEGFAVLADRPFPAFRASFDLLTTADERLKRRIMRLPCGPWLSRRLRVRADFVGSTVSEYVVLPREMDVDRLAAQVCSHSGCCMLTVVKDLPQDSPLLPNADNADAMRLARALRSEGYILVEGQALAYVAIDFESIDAYLARLSKNRRYDLRRKLKSREHLQIRRIPTGDAFADEALVDAYYAQFEAVYAQSEVHFDKLTRSFFAAVLRDASNQGLVFEYRHASDGALLGWNLCFAHDGRLIDKYIGLSYPRAREANLYFVSWMVNLEYALECGLSHYVAGWTDPEVKAQLGASFTFTQHAVYIRNPVLRALARCFSRHFEGDRRWRDLP